MPEVKRFQCLNCGHRFEIDVLAPDEKKEAKRKDESVYPVACPKCRRTDVRDGWGYGAVSGPASFTSEMS
ncbi:hypothetical protein Rleg4DRAFT_7707 [Rhizobium leguminosarum bv. trifolii WSM2297]|uniref:Zinc ribbon domain-containing protein n=1 Tax=Rhizobium leguminosarum bv. trifolii WSM2297 TaxID=754762 RepID=J0D0I5_RHILT|nr:hypothetical protein Rleg4DRAFT_7185 [Rhizobium leguminosarum bv. trifolii WSM2297]EJC85810.1 hypothetical protein Rleg4DRAFT_7707 [Rhizobium leguminosarum bv. trifolii WSM2297]